MNQIISFLQVTEVQYIFTGALCLGSMILSKQMKDKAYKEKMRPKSVDYSVIRGYMATKQLDPTKRRTLQPANQRPMPQGWTPDDERKWQDTQTHNVQVSREKSQEPGANLMETKLKAKGDGFAYKQTEEFYHKFFGSRLVIDDKEVKSGLTNKMHTLEITKDNKLYIDGEIFPINPTELEKMKMALRAIKR